MRKFVFAILCSLVFIGSSCAYMGQQFYNKYSEKEDNQNITSAHPSYNIFKKNKISFFPQITYRNTLKCLTWLGLLLGGKTVGAAPYGIQKISDGNGNSLNTNSILALENGDYAVLDTALNPTYGVNQILVTYFNSSGNFQWSNFYGNTDGSNPVDVNGVQLGAMDDGTQFVVLANQAVTRNLGQYLVLDKTAGSVLENKYLRGRSKHIGQANHMSTIGTNGHFIITGVDSKSNGKNSEAYFSYINGGSIPHSISKNVQVTLERKNEGIAVLEDPLRSNSFAGLVALYPQNGDGPFTLVVGVNYNSGNDNFQNLIYPTAITTKQILPLSMTFNQNEDTLFMAVSTDISASSLGPAVIKLPSGNTVSDFYKILSNHGTTSIKYINSLPNNKIKIIGTSNNFDIEIATDQTALLDISENFSNLSSVLLGTFQQNEHGVSLQYNPNNNESLYFVSNREHSISGKNSTIVYRLPIGLGINDLKQVESCSSYLNYRSDSFSLSQLTTPTDYITDTDPNAHVSDRSNRISLQPWQNVLITPVSNQNITTLCNQGIVSPPICEYFSTSPTYSPTSSPAASLENPNKGIKPILDRPITSWFWILSFCSIFGCSCATGSLFFYCTKDQRKQKKQKNNSHQKNNSSLLEDKNTGDVCGNGQELQYEGIISRDNNSADKTRLNGTKFKNSKCYNANKRPSKSHTASSMKQVFYNLYSGLTKKNSKSKRKNSEPDYQQLELAILPKNKDKWMINDPLVNTYVEKSDLLNQNSKSKKDKHTPQKSSGVLLGSQATIVAATELSEESLSKNRKHSVDRQSITQVSNYKDNSFSFNVDKDFNDELNKHTNTTKINTDAPYPSSDPSFSDQRLGQKIRKHLSSKKHIDSEDTYSVTSSNMKDEHQIEKEKIKLFIQGRESKLAKEDLDRFNKLTQEELRKRLEELNNRRANEDSIIFLGNMLHEEKKEVQNLYFENLGLNNLKSETQYSTSTNTTQDTNKQLQLTPKLSSNQHTESFNATNQTKNIIQHTSNKYKIPIKNTNLKVFNLHKKQSTSKDTEHSSNHTNDLLPPLSLPISTKTQEDSSTQSSTQDRKSTPRSNKTVIEEQSIKLQTPPLNNDTSNATTIIHKNITSKIIIEELGDIIKEQKSNNQLNTNEMTLKNFAPNPMQEIKYDTSQSTSVEVEEDTATDVEEDNLTTDSDLSSLEKEKAQSENKDDGNNTNDNMKNEVDL